MKDQKKFDMEILKEVCGMISISAMLYLLTVLVFCL